MQRLNTQIVKLISKSRSCSSLNPFGRKSLRVVELRVTHSNVLKEFLLKLVIQIPVLGACIILCIISLINQEKIVFKLDLMRFTNTFKS